MAANKNVTGYFCNRINKELKKLLVQDPVLLLDQALSDFKLEKRGRVSLVEVQGRLYVVKHYYVKSGLFWFRRAFFSSLASKVRSRNKIIQQNGISTPLLLASLDSGRGVFYRGTTCVYEYIKPDKNLDQLRGDFADPVMRDTILNTVIPFLAKMHHVGIYHGDAKISNFLWAQDSSKVEIYVIDLDDCKFEMKLSYKHRIADLATMIFSFAWWWSNSSFVLKCLKIYLQVESSWCFQEDKVLADLERCVRGKLAHRRARQKT